MTRTHEVLRALLVLAAVTTAACGGLPVAATGGDGGVQRVDLASPAVSALDGAATVLDAGSAPDASTGGATSDLEIARAFLKPLVLGFNVERGWAWSIPGGPTATAKKLAALGVTHVRLFFPWSPSVDFGLGTGVPSSAAMKTFFDAVQQWIDGGVVVFVDCTDVIGDSDFTKSKSAIYAEVTAMAAMAATYDFPKEKFAMGPINEWAGDSNGSDPFVTYRADLHDILRKALPDHVLTASSDYWDYFANLEKLTPLADQRMIYSFHSYEAHDASGWAGTAGALTSWSQKYGGVPILWGEAGVADSSLSGSPSAWPADLGVMASAMAVFRPTLWAITYGGAWRFNLSASDPDLADGTGGSVDLKSAVTAAIATATTKLAGNDGAP